MTKRASLGSRNTSNWRSVRIRETDFEREMRQRHVLWLHGVWIGLLVCLAMWAASHLQMALGVEWLGLRYLITLGFGYAAYLCILRMWAGVLTRQKESVDAAADMAFDGADIGLDALSTSVNTAGRAAPNIRGGGSDFADGGAVDVIGSLDEGAVVVIPAVGVVLIGTAVFFGAGSLMLLYFGSDVLLGVAVELAFAYTSGRVAVRVAREGWLSAAVRLTWKPLAGAMVCAALLGATIDYFIPQANSLPQAVKAIQGARR